MANFRPNSFVYIPPRQISGGSGVTQTYVDSTFLRKTGGQISGDLIDADGPQTANSLATKSYVDNAITSSGGSGGTIVNNYNYTGSFVGGSNVTESFATVANAYERLHSYTVPSSLFANPGDSIQAVYILEANTLDFHNYFQVSSNAFTMDLIAPDNEVDVYKYFRCVLDIVRNAYGYLQCSFFYQTQDTFFTTATVTPYGVSLTDKVSGGGAAFEEIYIIPGSQISFASILKSNPAGSVFIKSSRWEFKPFQGNNGPLASLAPLSLTGGILSLNQISDSDISPTAQISVSKLALLTANQNVVTDSNGRITTAALQTPTTRTTNPTSYFSLASFGSDSDDGLIMPLSSFARGFTINTLPSSIQSIDSQSNSENIDIDSVRKIKSITSEGYRQNQLLSLTGTIRFLPSCLDATIRSVRFTQVLSIQNATLSAAGGSLVFVGCSFDFGVNIENAFGNCFFIDCSFSGLVDIQGTQISGTKVTIQSGDNVNVSVNAVNCILEIKNCDTINLDQNNAEKVEIRGSSSVTISSHAAGYLIISDCLFTSILESSANTGFLSVTNSSAFDGISWHPIGKPGNADYAFISYAHKQDGVVLNGTPLHRSLIIPFSVPSGYSLKSIDSEGQASYEPLLTPSTFSAGNNLSVTSNSNQIIVATSVFNEIPQTLESKDLVYDYSQNLIYQNYSTAKVRAVLSASYSLPSTGIYGERYLDLNNNRIAIYVGGSTSYLYESLVATEVIIARDTNGCYRFFNGNLTNVTSSFRSHLNRFGDAMLGDFFLNRDPTEPLQAATKRYVDSVISSNYEDFWTLYGNILEFYDDLLLAFQRGRLKYVDSTSERWMIYGSHVNGYYDNWNGRMMYNVGGTGRRYPNANWNGLLIYPPAGTKAISIRHHNNIDASYTYEFCVYVVARGTKTFLYNILGGLDKGYPFAPTKTIYRNSGYHNWVHLPVPENSTVFISMGPTSNSDFWLSGLAFTDNRHNTSVTTVLGLHWNVNPFPGKTIYDRFNHGFTWNTNDWNSTTLAQTGSLATSYIRVICQPPINQTSSMYLSFVVVHESFYTAVQIRGSSGQMYDILNWETPQSRILGNWIQPETRLMSAEIPYSVWINSIVTSVPGIGFLDIVGYNSSTNIIYHRAVYVTSRV